MKKVVFLLSFTCFAVLIAFLSCKKNEPPDPCDGKGSITFTNKLDSVVSINIVQVHQTFTLEKDFSKEVTLAGDNPYEIKITGPDYYLVDTLMVLKCDELLKVIEPAK